MNQPRSQHRLPESRREFRCRMMDFEERYGFDVQEEAAVDLLYDTWVGVDNEELPRASIESGLATVYADDSYFRQMRFSNLPCSLYGLSR